MYTVAALEAKQEHGAASNVLKLAEAAASQVLNREWLWFARC